MSILLLTNSLPAEREFVEQLNFLGYEVYSSTKLIQTLSKQMRPDQIEKHFEIIIFSETLPDIVLTEICQNSNSLPPQVFRRTYQQEQVESKETEEVNGITIRYLPIQLPLEALREELIPRKQLLKGQKWNTSSLMKLNLSVQEQKVLFFLMDNKGNPVSREKCCIELWGSPTTSSQFARLSYIVKSIKDKIDMLGIQNMRLETVWGRGYKIEGGDVD